MSYEVKTTTPITSSSVAMLYTSHRSWTRSSINNTLYILNLPVWEAVQGLYTYYRSNARSMLCIHAE